MGINSTSLWFGTLLKQNGFVLSKQTFFFFFFTIICNNNNNSRAHHMRHFCLAGLPEVRCMDIDMVRFFCIPPF